MMLYWVVNSFGKECLLLVLVFDFNLEIMIDVCDVYGVEFMLVEEVIICGDYF